MKAKNLHLDMQVLIASYVTQETRMFCRVQAIVKIQIYTYTHFNK